MLPLQLGWYLPLPTPSNKIVLPTQKLTSYSTPKLTTHMLPYPKTHPKTHNSHATLPKNTPVKQCHLLPRSLHGSVACAPTLMRMPRAATALCARPGARSAMPLLVLQLPQQGGQQEWIVTSRLVLLHWQQLCLPLPVRQLPLGMGPSPGRRLLPPKDYLLWWRVRPCAPGRYPDWGLTVQALLLAWSI
jgi:hypothetical protein